MRSTENLNMEFRVFLPLAQQIPRRVSLYLEKLLAQAEDEFFQRAFICSGGTYIFLFCGARATQSQTSAPSLSCLARGV